jgi:AmiR/NasT family two-component response regulator
MTDSADSSQLSPKDLIEQARGIIMNSLDLNAAQALKVLRRMSLDTRTQMFVVAEQVINYNNPMEALRRLEEDALLRLTPETKREV